MDNMTALINKILDLNYDAVDTSIAVNCHVLASTYYLVVEVENKLEKEVA